VLVAGGQHFGALSSAQIYDPDSGQWFSAAPMSGARFGHAAALLADGRVLVAGGQNSGLGVLGSVEIYDPTQDAWFPAPSMIVPRTGHSAASINGGVLVTGGDNNGPIGTVEFFDGAEWIVFNGRQE
jgi:N-acetylneuraminic acid mutarotase